MKSFMFVLYSVFYNISKIFGIRKNSVVLVSMHNASFNDSLGYIKSEAERRGFKTYFVSRQGMKIVKNKGAKEFFKSLGTAIGFFIVGSNKIARAKYVFLNDTFMPLAYVKPKKKTVITQLWHAQGAFKKFGLDIEQPEEIRKREIKSNSRISYVVCSSVLIENIYAKAFGVNNARVLPLGSPVTDYYFQLNDKNKIRDNFDKRYPSCKDKKLVLYAPTFREDKEKDENILKQFDVNQLKDALGSDYEVLIRLHPQVHNDKTLIENCVDVTDFENVHELCLLSDMLITDYSSICMEFSIQNKPMIFYAYDLDDYKGDRDFYFDYESYVPGKVANNFGELIQCVKRAEYETAKNKAFKEFNFGNIDGSATKKVADAILK